MEQILGFYAKLFILAVIFSLSKVYKLNSWTQFNLQMCFVWHMKLFVCYFHGTLLNVMCQPGWEWSLGIMATCLYVAESLPCLPETTITLLIGYTPIPDKKFKL